MSTIDIYKLKSTLEKSGIFLIEYYIIDDKCAMIKSFMYAIQQFVIIYIPTKFRTDYKSKNMYELKSLEDVVDEEDYTQFDEFQINHVQLKASKEVYSDASKKYNKQISINGDGIEKFEKRLTRQIKRMNIPFSKVDHTIGIQNKKILALNFGDNEISLFYIKNYTKDIRCYMYIVNIKDLIDNIEEIQTEIKSINYQFISIVTNVIETNISDISSLNKQNYDKIIEKFRNKNDTYSKNVSEFTKKIVILDDEEKKETKKYKELFVKEMSTIRKNSLENEFQKIISSFQKKKAESIDSFIEEMYVYHIYLLLLEEISFDNFVMLKRVVGNFNKMESLFQ